MWILKVLSCYNGSEFTGQAMDLLTGSLRTARIQPFQAERTTDRPIPHVLLDGGFWRKVAGNGRRSVLWTSTVNMP